MSLPHDILEFLDRYPGAQDDKTKDSNSQFYSNKLRCKPDNMLIDEIHDQWEGDYATLEYNHGFIQWLFPIQEHGMNYQSQPLQRHEIESIKSDERCLERVLRSYSLMLDFYGMRLVNAETGLVDTSRPPRNHEQRYKNLMRSTHNYLRISRILKCLSELGLEHLNAGFLLHILNEQSENGRLVTSSLTNSMDKWWANCIRNEEEREWVGDVIKKVRAKSGWVFTREMYEYALERRKEAGNLDLKGDSSTE